LYDKSIDNNKYINNERNESLSKMQILPKTQKPETNIGLKRYSRLE